ncbi:uncharacterized protein LOC142996984 [Genypterus blacodes]|uniref:uncharacterized protein LOC142996984 n=1 Tax=Genypterus blacodes TaxID=154954 RepID=UPI003F76596A
MDEAPIEWDEEVMKQDSSSELLPEPLLIILSPPPPFLPAPGEQAMSWNKWQKSFEHYLSGPGDTELGDSTKCALLQNCLGQEGQRVYTVLLQSGNTYPAAISALTAHFTSGHELQTCRLAFRQRAQCSGETVEQFVCALEELLRPCEYGCSQDGLVLSQLIEKTNCAQLRERLRLEEDTLTLAQALVIGKEVESASSGCQVDSVDSLSCPVEGRSRRPRRGQTRAKLRAQSAIILSKSSRQKRNSFHIQDVSLDGTHQAVQPAVRRGRPRKLKPCSTLTPSDSFEPQNSYGDTESAPVCIQEVSTDGVGVSRRGRPRRGERRLNQRSTTAPPDSSGPKDNTYDMESTAGCLQEASLDSMDVPVQQAVRRGRPRKLKPCPAVTPSDSSQPQNGCHDNEPAPLNMQEVSHSVEGPIQRVSGRGRPQRGEEGAKHSALIPSNSSRHKRSRCEKESALTESTAADLQEASEERPVRRAVRRGRPRRGAAKTKLKPQSTLTPSNPPANKDFYYSNDKLYYSDEDHTDRADETDTGVVEARCDASDEEASSSSSSSTSSSSWNTEKESGNKASVCTKRRKGPLCPICVDKRFRDANKLERHMRTHTKEKPFVCPVCATTFSQSYHMTRHLRNQHGAAQHVCTSCAQSFGSYTELKAHKVTHAPLKTSVRSPVCGQDVQENSECSDHSAGGSQDRVKKQENVESSNKDSCSDEEHCHGGSEKEFSHDEEDAEGQQAPSACGSDHAEDKESEVDVKTENIDCDVVKRHDGGKEKMVTKSKRKGHFCPICVDRRFRGPSKLARHMRTHTKDKPFNCPVCAITFSQSYHMTRHLRNQHGLGQYICTDCGKILGNWLELNAHKKTHLGEGLICPLCDRQFKAKSLLANHIKTHNKVKSSPQPVSCAECGKVFGRMYHLKRHLETHRKSTDIDSYKCPNCQRSFSVLEELSKHLENHLKEMSGTCPKCNKSFSSPEELESHVEVHQKSYFCSTCGKKFKVEYAWKKHEQGHKQQQFYCSLCQKHFLKLSHYKRHMQAHEKRESKCPHCDRIFLKLTAFKFHLRTHTEERPHQCSCCIEAFTEKEDLEQHCMRHKKFRKERPYSCSRCDHAFSTLPELTEHLRSHAGEQPLNCPECGKTFLNKNKLEKHFSIHTGERPHLCSVCGNGFPSAASLKLHVHIHTGEKAFTCSQCSKSFKSASGLRLHSRQHMAVKPSYPCRECGRSYGRLTELKMHQRYHTGDKPYICTCCNKRFISNHKLNVHMRCHTGERPYTCPHCGQTFTQTGDRNRHMNKYHQVFSVVV